MTQPPAAAANAATGPLDPAAAELRRLQSACTGLSAQLHALARTRRHLAAQVSLLATEAVEAGCRGELWITHEGKSNESKFHRVVRSSEITCGKECGEVVREEEMSGSGGSGGGAKKGTLPTNNNTTASGAAATATAPGTAGSDSSAAEIRHKLCSVPGCTKKEQGKWYGKMCKRHWAEKNPNKTSPKKDEAVAHPEAGSIQPITSFGDGGNQVAAVAAASPEKNEEKPVDNSIIPPPPPPPPPAKTATADAAGAAKDSTTVKAPVQQTAAGGAVKVPTVAPTKPTTKVDEKTTTTSPVAGEKRPAEAEATAVSGAPSSSAQPSGERHLPQKKRKVEIDAEAASAEAGAGAGVEPKAAPPKPAAATSTTQSDAAPSASSAASASVKKDGVHQESGGKWSAAVLHTDGQSYDLGGTFDTKELATLALGAFRSTLANESRAAGGRISQAMVKQAREMARHAVLAKGRGKGGSGQKQT